MELIKPGDKVFKIKEVIEDHIRIEYTVESVLECGFVLLEGPIDQLWNLRSSISELIHTTGNKTLNYFLGYGECMMLKKFKEEEKKWLSQDNINIEIDSENGTVHIELNFEEIKHFFELSLALGKYLNSKKVEIKQLNDEYHKGVRERDNLNQQFNNEWNDRQDSLTSHSGFDQDGLSDDDDYNPINWTGKE